MSVQFLTSIYRQFVTRRFLRQSKRCYNTHGVITAWRFRTRNCTTLIERLYTHEKVGEHIHGDEHVKIYSDIFVCSVKNMSKKIRWKAVCLVMRVRFSARHWPRIVRIKNANRSKFQIHVKKKIPNENRTVEKKTVCVRNEENKNRKARTLRALEKSLERIVLFRWLVWVKNRYIS